MAMDPKDLDECYRCGAVVFSRSRHREWHEKIEGPEPKEERSSGGQVYFS
jgi:hypothetical protein